MLFYIDEVHPGVVRGGFFDRDGGLLVGSNAQWVCNALNEKLRREEQEEVTRLNQLPINPENAGIYHGDTNR